MVRVILILNSILFGTVVDGAARFVSNGPTLTVTVKDPSQISTRTVDVGGNKTDDTTTTTTTTKSISVPSWIQSLSPNILYSIQSNQVPPLPNWFPFLKSLSGGIGYEYNKLKRLPSWIEGTAKLDNGHVQLQIQPSYELYTKQTNLLLQAVRGAHYAFAKITSSTKDKQQQRLFFPFIIETLRGSMYIPLPYASIASVRVTPTIEIQDKNIICDIEAVTGGTGRTKIECHLEYDHPTISIQHQTDDRNFLRPTIDLYSGKVIYEWIIAFKKNGGSVKTIVDPTNNVKITWTDPSPTGRWITDIYIPLDSISTTTTTTSTASSSSLLKQVKPSVKVRRQFRF